MRAVREGAARAAALCDLLQRELERRGVQVAFTAAARRLLPVLLLAQCATALAAKPLVAVESLFECPSWSRPPTGGGAGRCGGPGPRGRLRRRWCGVQAQAAAGARRPLPLLHPHLHRAGWAVHQGGRRRQPAAPAALPVQVNIVLRCKRRGFSMAASASPHLPCHKGDCLAPYHPRPPSQPGCGSRCSPSLAKAPCVCCCREKTPPCKNCPVCKANPQLMNVADAEEQQRACRDTYRCAICACRCGQPLLLICQGGDAGMCE